MDRCASTDDRRVTLVRPSAAGSAALESFAMVRESDLVRRLLVLDVGERAAFADLLERITAPTEENPA